MKVEKNLIDKVANGETILKGEAVRIAKEIIEKELQSKFKEFAFFYQGSENEIYDVQDCILDFGFTGAEIDVLYNYPDKSRMQIFGMTMEQSLKRLFETLTHNGNLMKNLEGKPFKVNGIKGKFTLCYTVLHYCFAKGRINEKQCLDMMRI